MLCDVFKSSKKSDTYLYLPLGSEFDELPEALVNHFGTPQKIMTINLDKRDQLARISVEELKQHLVEPGYYLQLPPQQESML
ncbi:MULTISPECIES: YcgL domain-containing protein [unclassified Idiomarina]|jgi:hypothetical protein|uniref:YcgL domain-containing protein n=1 Tax=unclassified Idiomarina TaxID=2614829 RepID=UPI0008F7FB4B|nr:MULTISPECIES: YcgL domain-containing protein [unclassified Idiomarina]MAD53943.1 hypothetical protein [Idiomarinaceae bacterium]MEC7642414.1 YcgL domain-containing protein [Pseudomonadota bacterium]MEC9319748.1 YcgL domain-containing protein [Pseudomonadota bacterium]NQZ04112.1 YcgL domain-containing protein [Idiomarina sp.]OIN01703.1 hypothetical protein BFR57_06410 [Idiomarina sp. MD25a]|tara:strand:+ start:574 stop:819 length:246 start_codon:yes stop_codon:yes gene_type:complete